MLLLAHTILTAYLSIASKSSPAIAIYAPSDTDALQAGLTDNASVHTHPVKDSRTIVAMSEPVIATYKVDLDTLATISRVDHGNDGVPGNITTAHPVLDPGGSLYNIYLDVRENNQRCVQMPASEPHIDVSQNLAAVPLLHRRSMPWYQGL